MPAAAPRPRLHQRDRAHVPGRILRPSKHADPGSRTVVSGRRYYSPSQGRFFGRDPIDEKGGLNLYGFCGNNSINRWDYLGNLVQDADGGGVDDDIVKMEKFIVKEDRLPPIGAEFDGSSFDDMDPTYPITMGIGGGSGGSSVTATFTLNGSRQQAARGNRTNWLREGVSIGIGLLPFVGTVQSGVELITGRDHITGQRVSRWLAGIGVIAGIVPGGNAAVKSGAKIISKITGAEVQVFKSFRALKATLGSAGEGNAWHHIVEQSQMGRFGSAAVNNTDNVVAVSKEVNTSLNALYSSIRPEITGSADVTVRQWLRTQSYEDAYKFGLDALNKVKAGTWP